jgi:hypothetical protein
MSRALNINATKDEVIAACAKHKVPISAIETLLSGGTRVVMNNADDTARVAKIYGSKVMTGKATRVPTRMSRQ